MRIDISPITWIESRRTPWDERALGYGTYEITAFAAKDESELTQALRQLQRAAGEENVKLLFGRVPCEDRKSVLTFQQSGFHFVEASYTVKLRSLKRFAPPFEKRAALRKAVDADRAAIRNISATAFHYGRFAEDPRIDPALNAKRQAFWVDDLFDQGKQISVYETEDGIISFMAYEEKDGVVSLILGGSREGFGFASYLFWTSLLLGFREAGYTSVKTLISCANLGVLTLYARLGFDVEDMLIGLHCHLE